MARWIYQGFAQDANGTRIPGATVSVYLAGTTSAADVYAASSGGTSTHSVSTHSSTGAFSFYVDESDYSQNQQFKIIISKTGWNPVTLDDITIFPGDSKQYYTAKGEPGSGSKTLTAAMLFGGVIDEDPEGNVNWTTDTAANIVDELTDPIVGTTFRTILFNDATNTSTEVVTIVAGANVTLHGEKVTMTEGTNTVMELIFRCTNVTAGAETVDCYILTHA